jgi:hypothetical protein
LVIKTFRFCARVVTICTVMAGVLVTAVALRLMAGPVDLDFLKPRFLTEFQTPGGPVTVKVDRIYAAWGGLSQPMQVVFTGLHVLDASKKEIATAPSVALAFDARSAVRGELLPTSILVNEPTLDADISRDGGMLRRVFARTDGDSQEEFVSLLVEQLLAEHNYKSVLGQLDTVEVARARISLRDVPTGTTWVAPAAHVKLTRDRAGVAISAHARFTGPTSDPIDVRLSGTYARDRSRVSVDAGLDGFKPSMLSQLSPDAGLLRGVDTVLSGRLSLDASGNGDIRSVALEVTGGAGTVTLPGILPVSHKVRSVSALAHIDAASHSARIDHVKVDLGDVKISFAGTGLRTEQGQTFTGRAEITHIPIDRLGDYWPLEFAPGGRAWAVANLSGGSVDVSAEFAVSTPGNDLAQLKVDRNVALLDYRGMKVHYMSHMPELENVSGKARFEGGSLRFDVAGGTAVGLAVSGATVEMTGLEGPGPQNASLRIPIRGPASTVMALLLRPRLGLPRDVLYEPKRIGGDAAIELALGFPLVNELALGEIDIRAEAAVSAFSIKDVIGAVDLTDAAARLIYSNSQVSISGTGKLDGSPVDITIRDLFGPRVPYRHRYELKGTIPASMVAKAGFPPLEPYATGPIGITSLSYQVAPNGTGDFQGRFDLKGAKLAVGPLAWSKAPGADGQLTLAMKLAAGGKMTTADFDGRSSDLAVKGQARFGPDNVMQQVSVQHASLGRSDVSAEWRRTAEGVEATVRGRSLEWARVREALKARDEVAKAAPGGAAATARERTRFTFQLDRVLMERGSLGSLNGRLELVGDRVASAELGIGGGKGGTFRVTPDGNGRNVNVYVTDFGGLLREAGWIDGLVGGFLDLRGRYNDTAAHSPLTGKLKLGPYRLEKVAPRPQVGTLNSAIDGLNRAGNALQQFDGLDASITRIGDRIELRDGRTSGNSIGLTTSGIIDLAASEAHLRGVVVPGFALNNLLSNVPLLGPLLTGGKDGGVFAISYRLDGPLDDLKTDVNMMSAMTPGALRELLTGSVGNGAPMSGGPTTDRAP